jgi:tryptophan synthase beta chain
LGEHAARFSGGKPGVLHGAYTYLLQNPEGQIQDTHSISAGLDYAAVGPEHAHLLDIGRAQYLFANDKEALDAFSLLCKTEGILPALESSHALAYAFDRATKLSSKDIIVVNLSGRGDKDVAQLKGMEI